MTIYILKPGGACLLVDEGRWGLQRWGVPVGGPMDPVAWRLASALVGKPQPDCSLEVALGGTELLLGEHPMLVAVTGMLSHVYVGKVEVPANRPMWVAPHTSIRIPHMRYGSWCYIAFESSFALEPTLGSYSPLPGCDISDPFLGPLAVGTKLPTKAPESTSAACPRTWHQAGCVAWPNWGISVQALMHSEYIPLRFVVNTACASPQNAVEAFTGQVWQATPEMDRQGLRLSGQAMPKLLEMASSEPTTRGSIQVPPNGQPIILAADRQPTGGYPVIGTVAMVDHGRLGRLHPGARVAFTPISLSDAQRLVLNQHHRLELLVSDLHKQLQSAR